MDPGRVSRSLIRTASCTLGQMRTASSNPGQVLWSRDNEHGFDIMSIRLFSEHPAGAMTCACPDACCRSYLVTSARQTLIIPCFPVMGAGFTSPPLSHVIHGFYAACQGHIYQRIMSLSLWGAQSWVSIHQFKERETCWGPLHSTSMIVITESRISERPIFKDVQVVNSELQDGCSTGESNRVLVWGYCSPKTRDWCAKIQPTASGQPRIGSFYC